MPSLPHLLALPLAAAAACPAPAANAMLQTLVCATAQNTLSWSKVNWDANTGGSFQLAGTSLCMQAGPAPSAGSFLALQLAPCTGAPNQLWASTNPSGVASTWISHLDGTCIDANSGSQAPNEQLETYCACAAWRGSCCRPPPPPHTPAVSPHPAACSGNDNQLYTYNATSGTLSDSSWGYCMGTC